MKLVTEIFNSFSVMPQDNRCRIVGELAFGFCVAIQKRNRAPHITGHIARSSHMSTKCCGRGGEKRVLTSGPGSGRPTSAPVGRQSSTCGGLRWGHSAGCDR